MAYNLEIKCDSRIYVFAYIDYNVSPATPTGTDLIPLGWSDVPQQQLSATKMNVCSYSNYDFENSCSLGNWCTPFVVTGIPYGQTLNYGYNFGYSNSPLIPPSTWGKILAVPTGTYMWMEKYRIINNEAIRTLDFNLINNEVDSFISTFRGKIIHEYDHFSESMADRKISNATLYSNTTEMDETYTGKEYVEFENERYYLVPNEIKKVALDSTNGKYKYTLSFNNEYEILKRTPFKDIASIQSEPQFYTNQNKVYFINNITELRDRINFCLQKSYASYTYNVVFDAGFVPDTTLYKEINAENISIFDALKMFYDVYGVPYHIKEKQIIVGYEPEITEHNFTYHDGILDISKNSKKDFVTTSVSGKGGETNIPYRYPIIRDNNNKVIEHPYSSNYVMPTCYVESVRKKVKTDATDYNENELIVNSYEAVPNDTYLNESGTPVNVTYENYVNANNFSHEFVDFPDIFPTIVGTSYSGHRIDMIKSVDFEVSDGLAKVKDEDDISYFFIELYPLGFDLYAHASIIDEMVISMTSGDASGAQFRVIGDYDMAYFYYDVYFAKQTESTTYNASHFIKFYDAQLFTAMINSLSFPIENFTNYNGVQLAAMFAKIRAHINAKNINGYDVKTYLKNTINGMYTYRDYYANVFNDSGTMGAANPVTTLNNFINTFYSIWNSCTDTEFFDDIKRLTNLLNNANKQFYNARLYYLKDYSDNTYPPTAPYTAGDIFVTRVRDTANYPDSTNASITLKVYKDSDTYSSIIPNKYLKPKADDTFVILGIELPDTYIINAQRRLDKALKEYLKLKNSYNNNYTIKLSKKFLSDNLSIYNKIRCDYYLNFYFNSTLVKKQIKKVSRKFNGVFPDIDIELYNEEDKPKTIGNRLMTMEQIASSTVTIARRTENTNRKLRVIQSTQLEQIDSRINASQSLALSKNTLYESQPIPPYQIGDTWNDNGVLKRCFNGKPDGATFSSSDWMAAARTRQFVKTEGKETYSMDFDHEQLEDIVSKIYEIDADCKLYLHNSTEYKSENILYIKNIAIGKSVTLQLDMSDLVNYLIDSSKTIEILEGQAAQITINYTDDLTAMITIKNGFNNDNK